VEDWLYERGLCPRCVLRRRVPASLGEEEARDRTGLAPLFETLVSASESRAVLDWLGKGGKTIEVLGRIASGELPLSCDVLDAIAPALGTRAGPHLESLLAGRTWSDYPAMRTAGGQSG
jgi:hypothetical protein